MKGIEISHNNRTTTIGIENGLLIVHINCIDTKNKKDVFIYSSSTDFETKTQNTWHEFTPISIGEVFEIKIVDIREIDSPVKTVYDRTIIHPISKLEQFYKLESLLKEKNMI